MQVEVHLKCARLGFKQVSQIQPSLSVGLKTLVFPKLRSPVIIYTFWLKSVSLQELHLKFQMYKHMTSLQYRNNVDTTLYEYHVPVGYTLIVLTRPDTEHCRSYVTIYDYCFQNQAAPIQVVSFQRQQLGIPTHGTTQLVS